MPEELLNGDFSNKDEAVSYNNTEEIPNEMFNEDEIPYPISEDMSYVAIKGKFFTPKSDNAGVFCVIYKGDSGKVVFKELWAIRSDKHPSSDISDKWENFIKEMNKIGTYDKDSSEKLSPIVVQALNNNIKEYIYKNTDEVEIAQTEIRKALEKVLHYLVELDTEAEIFGEDRAEKGGILRNNKETASSEEAQKSDDINSLMGIVNFGGYPLICQPIINPINGCPVSNIKVGDIVHVVIPETNDIAKKVMDYLRSEGVEPAFPVSIVQPLESGKCAIILKINDEISGILNLSQEIMLKTDALPKTEKATLDKQLFNPATFLVCGLVLFIVLLLYFITHFLR